MTFITHTCNGSAMTVRFKSQVQYNSYADREDNSKLAKNLGGCCVARQLKQLVFQLAGILDTVYGLPFIQQLSEMTSECQSVIYSIVIGDLRHKNQPKFSQLGSLFRVWIHTASYDNYNKNNSLVVIRKNLRAVITQKFLENNDIRCLNSIACCTFLDHV